MTIVEWAETAATVERDVWAPLIHRDSNTYSNNQISGGVKKVWEHLR